MKCFRTKTVRSYMKSSKEAPKNISNKIQDWLISSMEDDPPIIYHLNRYVGNTAKSYKSRVDFKLQLMC